MAGSSAPVITSPPAASSTMLVSNPTGAGGTGYVPVGGVLGSNSLSAQITNEELDLANTRALMNPATNPYYAQNVASYQATIAAQVATLQSQGVANP